MVHEIDAVLLSIVLWPYFIDFSKIKLFFTLYSDGHGWKCTVCGKDLATKYSLARHIRRHVEETPQYSCEVCGLNFSWKESLNYHIRRKHHEFMKVSGFIHQEQFLEAVHYISYILV